MEACRPDDATLLPSAAETEASLVTSRARRNYCSSGQFSMLSAAFNIEGPFGTCTLVNGRILIYITNGRFGGNKSSATGSRSPTSGGACLQHHWRLTLEFKGLRKLSTGSPWDCPMNSHEDKLEIAEAKRQLIRIGTETVGSTAVLGAYALLRLVAWICHVHDHPDVQFLESALLRLGIYSLVVVGGYQFVRVLIRKSCDVIVDVSEALWRIRRAYRANATREALVEELVQTLLAGDCPSALQAGEEKQVEIDALQNLIARIRREQDEAQLGDRK